MLINLKYLNAIKCVDNQIFIIQSAYHTHFGLQS